MTAEKDVQVARKKGRGGVIWAMPERKHLFLKEVFPKCHPWLPLLWWGKCLSGKSGFLPCNSWGTQTQRTHRPNNKWLRWRTRKVCESKTSPQTQRIIQNITCTKQWCAKNKFIKVSRREIRHRKKTLRACSLKGRRKPYGRLIVVEGRRKSLAKLWRDVRVTPGRVCTREIWAPC